MIPFLVNDHPEKIAIQEGNTSISFGELQEKVVAFSQQLQRLPEAILTLNASPDITFIIQLLAALKSHRPVALLSNQWSDEEKQARIALLGQVITVDSQGNLLELTSKQPVNHHPELALILFTSGTTGAVKAVQLSQKNMMANCLAVIKALEFSKVEEQLLFLPLSYSFGLLGQLLPGLMSGVTTHLLNHFTEIKTRLETGQIPAMWSGVPSHWVAISKMASLYPESAAKIKTIVSAGAPLAVPLRAELQQRFPHALVYNNYGLTEASPRVLTFSSNDPLFMEPYAGYPIGDWQTQLSEDQELLIKGSQIMLGYLGEPNPSKVHNGWLHTGDIAEILPSGLVAIKGRRDNLVNIGGEKINLHDIEQKLSQLHDLTQVMILPEEDEIYGVRLLVCLEKHATSLNEQQLMQQIQKHLLPSKLPLTLKLIDKIPRNQHGKIDKKALSLDLKRKKNHVDR